MIRSHVAVQGSRFEIDGEGEAIEIHEHRGFTFVTSSLGDTERVLVALMDMGYKVIGWSQETMRDTAPDDSAAPDDNGGLVP